MTDLSTTGKSAVTSVGVWGSLGTIVLALAQVGQSGVVPPQWMPYVAAISGLLALYGRVKATKQITSVITPPVKIEA